MKLVGDSKLIAEAYQKICEDDFMAGMAAYENEALINPIVDDLCNIMLGEHIPSSLVDGQTGRVIAPAMRKCNKSVIRDIATQWVNGHPIHARGLNPEYNANIERNLNNIFKKYEAQRKPNV